MNRATCTVLFYVKRTKTLKDGNIPIFVRITVNNKRIEFGLQRKVVDGQWNAEKGKALPNSKQNKEINAYLDTVRLNIFVKKRELEEKGNAITVQQLKDAYLDIGIRNRTLLEIFKEHNDNCKKLVNIDFTPSTIERYETCYNHVLNFMKTTYKKKDIPINEVIPMFISDFELYLKTTRKCSHNTSTKYIKNFKKIIRIALANDWLKKDPFVNIKFHLDDVNMDFLDENELNALINKNFEILRLQQVKDVYLFCCFTGLAFVDVSSLEAKDIIKKGNQYWIKKQRKKTKNWCNIPLLAPAINILEKYRNNAECIKNGVLLPVISNQKTNSYLKEIADVTGIKKNLSTHTARHTFATTVTLANQVSMEVVSKMLGHSSLDMTKKYARVVDDLVKKDMDKVICKYDKILAN
jgi:site-specific recombinase XerD